MQKDKRVLLRSFVPWSEPTVRGPATTNSAKSPKHPAALSWWEPAKQTPSVCVQRPRQQAQRTLRFTSQVPRENKHFITIARHPEMAVETSDGLKTQQKVCEARG